MIVLRRQGLRADPGRHLKRTNYRAPEWNQQTYRDDFSLLYTAAKFIDKKQDSATAECLYDLFNIDLVTPRR